MDPKKILLLGVKGSVVAFQKDTGARLWATRLKKSGMSSGDFVSVAADDQRVYAHTAGEIFCLDLQTGNGLWNDELPGFGYGVASLVFPGVPPTVPAAAVETMRQQHAAVAASSSTSH